MFIGYFIMGRSENSRNRVFDPIPERGGICTMAADPDKLEDPSLIIYNPVLTLGRTHRDQRRPDRYHLRLDERGKTFEDALRTRTFEPDGPNYTPASRRCGVCDDGSYPDEHSEVCGRAMATASSAISSITRSPLQARAISSAPQAQRKSHSFEGAAALCLPPHHRRFCRPVCGAA